MIRFKWYVNSKRRPFRRGFEIFVAKAMDYVIIGHKNAMKLAHESLTKHQSEVWIIQEPCRLVYQNENFKLVLRANNDLRERERRTKS